jgi:heme/copper-type cytochrome/quinol oxidase subunit 2
VNVLALTIFITLWLVTVFVFFFVYQHRRGAGRSEQDALRPLDEEKRRTEPRDHSR